MVTLDQANGGTAPSPTPLRTTFGYPGVQQPRLVPVAPNAPDTPAPPTGAAPTPPVAPPTASAPTPAPPQAPPPMVATAPTPAVAPAPSPVAPVPVAEPVPVAAAAVPPMSAAPAPPAAQPTGVAPSPAPLPISSIIGAPQTQVAPGAAVSPTNPANDLRSQTILPGPTVDRFAIAQSQLKNFNDATEPYYQKALRDANSQAASSGQLGSGMLRTSLGDLANQRNLQLETQGNDLLNQALSGSIEDAYRNIGVAQQQQGFQAGQQQNAFNQAATQTGLQDQLTNSATNRALQQLLAGSQGNPADTQLILSQLFGNQASQAGSSLSNMIGGTVNRNAQTASNNALQQLLGQLGIGSYGGVGYGNGGTSDLPPLGVSSGAGAGVTMPTSIAAPEPITPNYGGSNAYNQTLLNLGIMP